MFKKKKGFTLVELLAVIVILAVVILIAVTAVIPRMNKAKKNAFIDDALIYLKAAEEAYAFNDENIETSCVNIADLNDNYVKKAGDNYAGTITTELINGGYVQTISLTNGKYYLVSSSTNISSNDVQDTRPQGFKSSCGNNNSIVAQCSSDDSSCPVTLPASLDGYSSVDVVQMGKNLLKLSDDNYNQSQKCSYSYTSSGIDVTASGTYARVGFTIPVKIGTTYTFSYRAHSTGDYNRVSLNSAVTWGTPFYTQVLTETEASYTKTFTATTDVLFIGFYVTANGTTGNMSVSDIMLEVGDTASDFSPYVTPTTHTVPLGRTIYGGSVDVVKGEGTDEYEILTLAVADMNNSEDYPGWRDYGVRAIIGAEVSSGVIDGVSSFGQYWNYNTRGNNDIIFMPKTRYNNMTQTDWKTNYPDLVIKFAIQKATPETFTFTPININS